jgi:tetratricopeptide (TPR) repeat protein
LDTRLFLYDQTIEQAQRMLEVNSTFPLAMDLVGMANEQKGNYGEAMKAYQSYIELGGGGDCKDACGASLCRVMGKQANARKLVREMENQQPGNYAAPYEIGSIYAALGEPQRELACVSPSLQEQSGYDALCCHRPASQEPGFEAIAGWWHPGLQAARSLPKLTGWTNDGCG